MTTTQNNIRTIEVNSSCGEIYFNAETGEVTECNNTSEDPFFGRIKKFDIAEYKKHYGVKELPSAVDILDLGYWLDDDYYEEPAHDWRKEFRHLSRFQ